VGVVDRRSIGEPDLGGYNVQVAPRKGLEWAFGGSGPRVAPGTAGLTTLEVDEKARNSAWSVKSPVSIELP
jgi:hypothetical protein